MASFFYIKCNPILAKELELTDPSLRLPDGNFRAVVNHFKKKCAKYEIRDKAPLWGALILEPGEMKKEIDGLVVHPLPVAIDPRYRMPEPAVEQEEPQTSSEPVSEPEATPQQEESQTETETPAVVEEEAGETEEEQEEGGVD